MTIRFFVFGNPQPQPRPRARAYRTKSGKHIASVYSPKTPWRRRVEEFLSNVQFKKLDGPLSVHLDFFFERPKSHLRVDESLRAAAPEAPISKNTGDLDNLEKTVLDAMNGIAYYDDSQIVFLRSTKTYAGHGEPSGVNVHISKT